MIKRSITFALLTFVIATSGLAQNTENLKAINIQVWQPFCKAFAELDPKPMAAVHRPDLVRVSANSARISDYNTYVSGYERRFKKTKEAGGTNHITLRFFERLNNDSVASERGVYQLVVNAGQTDEKAYYGEFQVLLKREGEVWKILMDYDSDENNTVGEKQFMQAHAMDDYQSFLSNGVNRSIALGNQAFP